MAENIPTTRSTRSLGVAPTPSPKFKPNEGDPDCPLFMECTDEPLSESQRNAHKEQTKQFLEQMKRLEQMSKASAKVTQHENGTVSFRVTESSVVSSGISNPPFNVSQISMLRTPQPIRAPQQPANYRLLIDPVTRRVLGTLNNPTAKAQPIPRITTSLPPASVLRPVPPPTQIRRLTPLPSAPISISNTRTVNPSIVRMVTQPSSVNVNQPVTSSNEKTKNHPSLNVQPKVQKVVLNLSTKRAELDQKVKQLLVLTPQKFTEWLMQQYLIPQQQYEGAGNKRCKLKLGLYQQDPKRYPHSGGYVWISEKFANRTTSVYKGSIFEIGMQPPTVILKLLYHWACQTNINNVIQWVKVDMGVIDIFYQVFRAISLASVQNELVNLGGSGKIVEIGVISLGTTSQDGSKRDVRVEVLGVMERSTGNLRLRATEPRKGITQSERFQEILKPLPHWVNMDSKIVTDNSIDKEKLRQMGYHNVYQNPLSAGKKPEGTNNRIMEYLKKIVPRMFHNSLAVLSTTQIQQFLDELTFREICGNYPLLCFDSMIERTATQTKEALEKNTLIRFRVKKIAENPFMDWRINVTETNKPPVVVGPKGPVGLGIDALPPSLRTVDPPMQQNVIKPSIVQSVTSSNGKRVIEFNTDIDSSINKKIKVSSSGDLIKLESHYYCSLAGDIQILAGEFKADMAFKCHLCKKVFMNNLEFMKHLSLHVENERSTAVDIVDLFQCRYCFKDFDHQMGLNNHIDEIHKKKGFSFMCKICQEGFKQKTGLIHHMSTTHVKYEMPYLCNICGFRSSFHDEVIDHFQENHDRTDKLQCPICLKTIGLCADKGYNFSMASTFVSHIESHHGKKYKCKKCCLSFTTEKDVKSHYERDHVTFKGFDNIDEYQYSYDEEGIKMPKPEERFAKPASKKISFTKPQQQAAFAAQNLEDLVMYDVEQEDCGECGKKLTSKSHFAAYLCCTKCRYSTCCSKAMSGHVGLFHGSSNLAVFDLGTPFYTPTNMYCCCGFMTMSGNKMAKHLAANGCRSAYPDSETANKAAMPLSSATFAPLLSVDESDDIESFDPNEVMAKAYHQRQKGEGSDSGKTTPSVPPEEQGPLAFLGLQRKTSTDENNSLESTTKDEEKKDNKKEGEKKLTSDETHKSEQANEAGKSEEIEDMEIDEDSKSKKGGISNETMEKSSEGKENGDSIIKTNDDMTGLDEMMKHEATSDTKTTASDGTPSEAENTMNDVEMESALVDALEVVEQEGIPAATIEIGDDNSTLFVQNKQLSRSISEEIAESCLMTKTDFLNKANTKQDERYN